MPLADTPPERRRSSRAAKQARDQAVAAFDTAYNAGVDEGRAQAAARIHDALRILKERPAQAGDALEFLRLTVEEWHPRGQVLGRALRDITAEVFVEHDDAEPPDLSTPSAEE